jgi:hypothetical protein
MIEAVISLLVLFLVLACIWWVIRLVASHFGAPYIFIQVAGIILFLIWLLYAVRALGGGKYLRW